MAGSSHETNVVQLAVSPQPDPAGTERAAIRDVERHLVRANGALEAYVAQANEIDLRLHSAIRWSRLIALAIVWVAGASVALRYLPLGATGWLWAAAVAVLVALTGSLLFVLGLRQGTRASRDDQLVPEHLRSEPEFPERSIPAQMRAEVDQGRSSQHSRAPSPFADGLVLSRYRLLEQLGSGAFAAVWRAHDELLDRKVAVKRVWLGPHGDIHRATREALAAARLTHPAIVTLYEACTEEGAFYLISELVDGDTLARLIATEQLKDEELLKIGVALASALEHAHVRGVIHRDVKPQNVLVPHPREDGAAVPQAFVAAAKLTDFGGASLVGEDALTRTGDVVGTLAYMAPEQSEGFAASPQTDLYSLALVVYEALSGKNPVRGATPAATVRRIGSTLPPLARSRRDLPVELTRAIDVALASVPEDRGTLEQLRLAFEDALRRTVRSQRWQRVKRDLS